MPPTTEDARKLIHDGLIALNGATKYGMCLDVKYCESMHKRLQKRLNVLENKVKSSKLGRHWKRVYSKMNIRSDAQLSHILFTKLELPVLNLTDKGNPSVNANTLELLSKEMPDIGLINDYKRIYIVDNTFLKGFLREHVDGILHPFFNLHNIITFRSGSSNPNFQQLPKRDKLQKKLVRRAIKPRKGHLLLEADFGGIEIKVACCVTKDKKLTYDAVHGDMHRDMAIEIFKLDKFEKKGSEKELRFAAKNGFIFAQFYGDYYGNNVPSLLKLAELPLKGSFKDTSGKMLMTGINLGEHLINKGIKNVKQFTDHIEAIEYSFWNKRYKEYGNWRKAQVRKYKKKGYLKTVTGFTCSGIMSKNQITNTPMQGPAFHCLLKSFIKIDETILSNKMNTKQIGQIHDATVLDVDPVEKDYILENLGNIMTKWLPEQWDWITVPLEVESDIYKVDETWASKPETLIL